MKDYRALFTVTLFTALAFCFKAQGQPGVASGAATYAADQDKQPTDNNGLMSLLTVAEKTDYRGTSTYREVMDFCESLARMSPLVHLTDMGSSTEGRKLPLLILADPPISSPEEAAKSGKLIVMAQGDIHAGEVD